VIHRREILVAEAGVAVLDRLAGAGVHRVEVRWPFATIGARVRVVEPGEAAALDRLVRTARLRTRVDVSRVIEVPASGRRVLLAFALPSGLAVEVAAVVRSASYGTLADACTAIVSGALRCPTTLATLVVLLPR
jgi:hypothetical protein